MHKLFAEVKVDIIDEDYKGRLYCGKIETWIVDPEGSGAFSFEVSRNQAALLTRALVCGFQEPPDHGLDNRLEYLEQTGKNKWEAGVRVPFTD